MKEIEKITSRDNRRLVNARKIRDGKVNERIFIEGRRLCEEALRSDLYIEECFIAADLIDDELTNAFYERGSSIADIPNQLFASLTDTKQPQGIVLIAKRPKSSLAAVEASLKRSNLPIVIFLKEINNPSNLGAVLRTAEAAGAAGVVVSSNSADVFSPKALRASMGAAFRLPILEGADYAEMLLWAKAGKLATTVTGASVGLNYVDIDWKRPRLLIFGSEAHGLDDAEIKRADEAISIPIENEVDSLNLAVSTGIILFEAKRQNS